MIAALDTTVSPGIYDGVTRSVYERWPAINQSTLKHFEQPPAKAKYEIDHPPEPTKAYQIGDATHAAVLQPEIFDRDWVRGLSVSRRSKEDKLAWEEFEEANKDKQILPADDFAMCEAMRDAIWSRDSVVRSILKSPGRNERSFVWNDGLTGELCKGRCDGMRRWDGWTIVFDLKTARSAAMDDFAKDAARFHYFAQAAFYLDGLSSLADVPRRWVWIVLEKEPPYLYAAYEPDETDLGQGRRAYRRWLAIYRQCRDTDTWPGYENGIQTLRLPRWARDFNPESF